MRRMLVVPGTDLSSLHGKLMISHVYVEFTIPKDNTVAWMIGICNTYIIGHKGYHVIDSFEVALQK